MLGPMMLESGQKQEAVPLLEKSVLANPEKWLAHDLLAFAYARTGALDKALEQAQKTSELNRQRVPAMRLLETKILWKQQKREESRSLLETILNEYPNDPAAKEARAIPE